MPALNFMKSMAPLVESGEKRQTIRRPGRFKVGDRIQLFTGLRTKACLKLGESTCTEVLPIVIDGDAFPVITIGLKQLNIGECEEFFHADGFLSEELNRTSRMIDLTDQFLGFFRDHYGLPFTGELIKWGDLIEKEKTRDA
jgi:hypothetical protein